MFFKVFPQRTKRIYLDYVSSTPVDETMLRGFSRIPHTYAGANPGALHQEGVKLKKILSSARARVARVLSAHPDEIIFTASATESDNLAILGTIRAWIRDGVSPEHIVVWTSPFEHSAVQEAVAHIDSRITVKLFSQEHGVVDERSVVLDVQHTHALISVMFIQNEIGTVQPIKEIAKHVRKLRKTFPEKTILFHTDATQAPLYYDLNVLKLGVDMVTLGATKLYCHKGVGMLWKRRGVTLAPLYYGGGQERGLRPGTEPVALIHEFSCALEYAQTHREKAYGHTKALQEYFESTLTTLVPAVHITSFNVNGEPLIMRSPHITHVVVPDMDSELLVIELDARGVAVSSKSACKNDQDQDSGIMSLLYPNQTFGAIRASYGRKTTKRELDKVIKAIAEVLKKYQK